jgi:hypothetical protein
MRKRGRSIPRRLELRHLPYTIARPFWAKCITFSFAMVFAAGCAGLLWLLADGLAATLLWYQLIFYGLATALSALIAALGIDRSFGFRVIIDEDGIAIRGLLMQRRLTWLEIRDISFKRGRWFGSIDVYMVGHIGIHVDGSNNPRRHWSSLWFGYYDIPRLMEVPVKELTRLLRHAKRRADAGWTAPTSRAAVS